MKIGIVKEPSLLRDGMVMVLNDCLKNTEVKAFSSKESKVLFRKASIVDVLVVDLDTKIDVFKLVNFYKKTQKKVIVWTSDLNDSSLTNLFKLDLHGYFFNGMEKDELLSALQMIISDKKYIHKDLVPILLGHYVKQNKKESKKPVGILTNREWEILECLTKGAKNEHIAESLFLSERTVKTYVSSILKKLDVPDRTNAVIKALKKEWFFV